MASIDRYERRMAKAFAWVINLLDPEAIVLGGGMSNVSRLYDNVPRLWGEWVYSKSKIKTKLRPPRHGDASGVRGRPGCGHRTPSCKKRLSLLARLGLHRGQAVAKLP
jgi:predicted NBD/HSP70 family sugar kinase